jgi:hypothetical protein
VPWTLNRFLEEAKIVHGSRYNYDNVIEVTDGSAKIPIVCSLHGEFLQSPMHHIARRQGCPMCGGTRKGYTEKFIEDARSVHGSLYDYGRSVYRTVHKKIEIVCRLHGSFWQSPASHVVQGSGCPKCSGVSPVTEKDFVERATKLHGSVYDYSRVQMRNMRTPVTIICPFHGPFEQIPAVHLGGSGCKACRNPVGNLKIGRALKQQGVDFKEEFPISDEGWPMPLRLDFALFKDGKLTAAIEYHGEQHYRPVSWSGGGEDAAQQEFGRIRDRDERKRDWCNRNSVTLLEIPYTDLDLADQIATEFALAQVGSAF